MEVTTNASLAELPSLASSVEVGETTVHIRDLLVDSRGVADYLRSHEEGSRRVALVQALEVGAHCLQCAASTRDVDFVRLQVTALLDEVEKAVERIPETVERGLVAKIGVEEGQVLAPVRLLLGDVRSASSERLSEVRTLLTEEIDPTRDSSTLGKALRALTELLDPRRTDSVQGTVQAAVHDVSASDGALAEAVKKAVAETVGPLATEVSRLAFEFRGEHAADEALLATTAKGPVFELRALGALSTWARHTGAQITHVGGDNKPGDIVIEIEDSVNQVVRIVVEARNRKSALGRKGIADSLDKAMRERKCASGVYVSQSAVGFTNEIGEWAEGTTGTGDFVATTDEHLITAVRFLLVQRRISQMKEAQRVIDEAAVQTQLARIKTALTRIATIKRNVTDVRSSVDAIESESDALRADVRSALLLLEDAVSAACPPTPRP